MRDLQNETTPFPPRIIQNVGVEGIPAMLSVHRAHNAPLSLLARFTASCPLSIAARGINMSRMARTIYACLEGMKEEGASTLEGLAYSLMNAQDAAGAEVSAAFDYPIDVASPISGIMGIKTVQAVMYSKVSKSDAAHNTLSVTTSEMSLCPCSQEMSLLDNGLNAEERDAISRLPQSLQEKLTGYGRGAHNQIVDITSEIDLSAYKGGDEGYDNADIESIYAILSSCASAVTYPVLKREDEKYTTECAWSSPRFVEDIARIAADKIGSIEGIKHFIIDVSSHESIHSDGIKATARIRV